jgi:hypothetical protein
MTGDAPAATEIPAGTGVDFAVSGPECCYRAPRTTSAIWVRRFLNHP